MSFLNREEKREIRSGAWYVGSRSAVVIAILVALGLAVTAASLLWWQPWTAKRHQVIQRQAIVHSQQYVDAQNRQLELDEQAAEGGDDAHLAAAAPRIKATAGRLNWSEITPGNQSWICNHGPDFEPANAGC